MQPSVSQRSLDSLLTALGNPRGHRLLVVALHPHPLISLLAQRFDRVDVQLLTVETTIPAGYSSLPPNVICGTSLDTQLTANNEDFDAILLLFTLFVPPEPEELLSNSIRLLRDRGRVIVVEISANAHTESQQKAVAIEKRLRNPYGSRAMDTSLYSPADAIHHVLTQCDIHHLRTLEVPSPWTTRFGDTISTSPERILQHISEYLAATSESTADDLRKCEEIPTRMLKDLCHSTLSPLDLTILHGVYKPRSEQVVAPVMVSNSPELCPSDDTLTLESNSLSELLSLVMTGGESAIRMAKLARRVLEEYGSRAIAEERDPRRVAEALDISITLATQVVALFEIARRFFAASDNPQIFLRGPEDIASYATGMANLHSEQFRVLCINEHHHLIAEKVIASGTESGAHLHPRDILRPALLCQAATIAFVHNHPSGDPTPSTEDIEMTRQICRAAEYIGIPVLDHVIIVPNGWFSMRNAKLLQ